MLRYAIRRVLLLLPILFGLSILVFAWIRALPGSPAQALLGEHATPEDVARIRHQYGLDQSLPSQYWHYLWRTVGHLDLGTSITSFRPVTEELGRRFPATVELALAAMLFAILLGVPLGFLAAKRHRSSTDHLTLVASLVGISIPVFVLGLLLKYVFAVRLGWLPTVGRESVLAQRPHPTNLYILDAIIEGDPAGLADALEHLVLPAIALGSIPLAIVTRITRAATLEVLSEDYVRTARAKGLPPLVVDLRHILRNALLPIATTVGLQTGLLLSGAVLTETVFAWPGVGSWLTHAIFTRDYPVLQGGVLFLAVVFVLVNLVVDLAYAFIDPRIRLG